MSLPLPAFVASVGDAMTNAAVKRMTAVKIPTRPNHARVRVALISYPPRFPSGMMCFEDCAAPYDGRRDVADAGTASWRSSVLGSRVLGSRLLGSRYPRPSPDSAAVATQAITAAGDARMTSHRQRPIPCSREGDTARRSTCLEAH